MHRHLLLSLLLCAAFAPIAASAQGEPTEAALDEARALYQEGVLLYKEGDYIAAAEAFTRAYELTPKPELAFNIGQSYDKAGEPERAEHWRQIADGQDPELPYALTVRDHITAQSEDARACYTLARGLEDGRLDGELTLLFTINDEGRVENARVEDDTLGSAELNECLTALALGWTFPPPKEGPVEISHPLRFTDDAPKDDEDRPKPEPDNPGSGDGSKSTLSKHTVLRVMRNNNRKARACFERVQAREPGLSGAIMMRFTITPEGQVQSVTVVKNDVGSDDLAACLTHSLKRWKFPKSRKQTTITFPFKFP